MQYQQSNISRLPAFDVMRIIAMIGILLCHSCYEFSSSFHGFGRYLGMTFNFLFLAFSALLLGLSWEKNKFPPYKLSYVWKRVAKLSRSYYPYLVVLFAFLYLSEDYFNWKNIISHSLYLPWFDKINGFGHLWFMTMIVICYFASCFITRLPLDIRFNSLKFNILLMGGGILLSYIINSMGLPGGNLFTYLTGYILIYRNTSQIIQKILRLPIWCNVLQCILINCVIAYLFIRGIYDYSKFISGILGVISACSLFVFFYRLLHRIQKNKILEYTAGITFEIYLVHEFFLGRFSVYRYIENPFIGFIVLVVLSFIAGAILHYISSLIQIPKVQKNSQKPH